MRLRLRYRLTFSLRHKPGGRLKSNVLVDFQMQRGAIFIHRLEQIARFERLASRTLLPGGVSRNRLEFFSRFVVSRFRNRQAAGVRSPTKVFCRPLFHSMNPITHALDLV